MREEEFGEMIEAIKANHVDIDPLAAAMAELVALKKAHEERERKEDDDDDDDDDDQLCDYRLTGTRDRRGLIDLEEGLTFTAIPRKSE